MKKLSLLTTLFGLVAWAAPAATVWVTSAGHVILVDAGDAPSLVSTNVATPIRVNPADAKLADEIQADLDAVRFAPDADAEGHPLPKPVPRFVFVPVQPGALHVFAANRTVRLMTAAEQEAELTSDAIFKRLRRVLARRYNVPVADHAALVGKLGDVLLAMRATNALLAAQLDAAATLAALKAAQAAINEERAAQQELALAFQVFMFREAAGR